ncbi:amino acid adenylation domain-containing protein [Nostoc sp.]|uniref:amino acid adenylation domain-containing protein n=1 Tax=Nostoc sp. TaxID=1180 RepID=UPI002FF53028
MQNSAIEGFQISPQQKRLWLLAQEGDRQAYRVQCAVLIEGDIKYSILEVALQKIVDRYEILRTNLQALKEMNIPLQVIHENSSVSINYYNFHDLDSEKQQGEIANLFQLYKQRNFDWQNGSVLDISLISFCPIKNILMLALPSFCADIISINNLLREISDTYTACLHQQELANEPLQYADISAWQIELFEGEDAVNDREYWRKQNISNLLKGKLPREKSLPTNIGFQPQFIDIHFHPDILDNIQALAQTNSVSVATVLMACWQILIWRLLDKSEMAIAICCDGRNYEELKPAIGLLAKYLPVAADFDENATFAEILPQIQKKISDVYQWQETFNWEEIVSSNGKSQELSFFPFAFDFGLQPTKYLADNVTFSINKQYGCIERFQVKLFCLHGDDSLTAELHYDANLFTRQDMDCLAAQFNSVLASAINNPTNKIAQLNILSPDQRQQLLFEFNKTQTNHFQHQCIHELFEQQVERYPEQIAVVYENQQLSYAQLNSRANQLAQHLQTVGVGCETIVALCVERSLEMIVGLLGILKAGGAYLALDPLLPSERLAFMLQDADSSLILTQQHLTQLFSKTQAPIICLDTDWGVIDQQSDENLQKVATPENLVYVVYTSGSTGKPKGVAVEHQQLLNYLYSIQEKLDLPANASFASVSTFAADLGNTAIFPALCTGGCLHVISQERATSPEALADYRDRHPIDCLKIVPSHLDALLSASQPEKILPKKRLILGGEALNWKLAVKLQQYAPECQIFNHYGPSEATVGVLTFMFEGEPMGDKSDYVPIGRPLTNTQVYILDNYLQPVPLGVSGELYIGGNSLVRGYLNHPELTRERFIPNPFQRSKGAKEDNCGRKACTKYSRLYKTGDLARYLPDGNIAFLRRIDDQVKIRGFRIELAEIESVLRQHPAIQESIVLARPDNLGNKRLIAYFVSNQQSESAVSDLRNFLKEKLPEYMLPAAFVQIKALPLTPNGKVDRQALPNPDSVKPELAGKFVTPRNPIEEAIAKIWSGVLELKQVGIYDNFFELGGDSIISIQIIARLNQAGLQLTPKQLFENPTIAGLAAIAGTILTIKAEQEAVTGSFPLTPIQHWFFEQKLGNSHHWNQALLLEVASEIAPDILEQTIQQLRSHHDALRLRFVLEESGWQQVNAGVDELKAIPCSYVDLSALSVTQQAIAFETTATQLQTSLNITEGLLMGMALFNFGDNQPQRLLWVIHHLAVDGISWRILLEDFQQVYQQLNQGEKVKLPAKTTSFKQWSNFLQEYAQTVQLQQELRYWLQTSHQSISPLPIDDPDGANTVALSRSVLVSLSIEETQALLQDVPAVYHTQINDVLLTALVQAFAEWIGSSLVLIDLEGHGRESITDNINLSRTVGWFTTIFPVLLTLEGTSQPGEALKAIKEQLRSIPNHGIGYGILRYLNMDSSITTQLQNLPQPEVRFNYLGQFDQVLPKSSQFKLVNQTVGISRSLQDNRRYLIDINGFVLGSQLQLEWTYSEQIHRRTTIEQLAQEFIKALRSLITHCQSPEAGGYTPSDFPEANLSQKDLEQFLTKINRGSGKTSK